MAVFAMAMGALSLFLMTVTWLHEDEVQSPEECQMDVDRGQLLHACFQAVPFTLFMCALGILVGVTVLQSIHIDLGGYGTFLFVLGVSMVIVYLLQTYVANEIRIYLVQQRHVAKSPSKNMQQQTKRYGVEGIRAMHPLLISVQLAIGFVMIYGLHALIYEPF